MRAARFALSLAGLALCLPASATVKPNGLFTDNAVLQQGIPIPVWGDAKSGEKVTVRFDGQTATTTAKDGRWRVTLKAVKAGGPYDMSIEGENQMQLHNILVGEVWVCSGQSNMEWSVRNTFNADQAIAASKDPMLRLYTVPRHAVDQPESDVSGKWDECAPETVRDFTAVGYFFGRDLRKARNVPVGLISTNVGGTPAEAWTRREVLWNDSELKPILERYANNAATFERSMIEFQMAEAKARANRSELPKPPQNNPINYQRPAGLYNGMIAPLIPYGIRGAIWYQGESNAGAAYQYRHLFPTMIDNWRKDWGEGAFPFFFVQLAPFMKITTEPGESAWAELREAQLITTKISPKTGMAVITDVGEENDIHPRKKEPVGARLALAARGIAYGEKIEYSGPELGNVDIKGDKIELKFTHAKGLKAESGEVKGFTIAGSDRKFYNAQAKIQGDKVIVWSDKVPIPAAVRYGWANYPVVNLQNSAGLYASPFRTDDWPITTGPR